MKKIMFSALAVSAVALTAFTSFNPETTAQATAGAEMQATPAARSFVVNTAKSNLAWDAKKVTGQHNGHIKINKGQLMVENNQPVSGEFEIDMRTITCTDITDAGYNQKLVGHLKSDDFFSVEKHPIATFKAVGIAQNTNAKDGSPTHVVRGNLTIKGITNMISFPANITTTGNEVKAKADFTIDRSKWDIRYGSNSFFEGLGDKAIYDDIRFTLDLVAAAGK